MNVQKGNWVHAFVGSWGEVIHVGDDGALIDRFPDVLYPLSMVAPEGDYFVPANGVFEVRTTRPEAAP